MADASCGPSNAFKGLARHVEQDRSHQQDRVAPGSQHPTQNFRSTPLNTGLTDQFSAFQQQTAALPQHPTPNGAFLPHPADVRSHPAQAATFFPPHFTQKPAAFAPGVNDSWVNDFQRMGLSNTQEPVMGQLPIPFSLASSQLPTPQSFVPPSIGLHPMNQQFGSLAASNNMHMTQFRENASPAFEARAKADLDQEFEDAMNEWMAQNGPEVETRTQGELGGQDDNSLAAELTAEVESTAREVLKEDSAEDQEQETELARAAQQLVDSVADNDSEKFKNSEFLALMRRIASQQLTVQGNDLVERPQPPLNTDASSDPHTAGTESADRLNTTHQPVSTVFIPATMDRVC
ncbi:hypothetical protein F5X97DRAFT_281840 [Nemania serpens]|nr:hypothetical protein F5X97DRAFT_281840 [Nemania serpens]